MSDLAYEDVSDDYEDMRGSDELIPLPGEQDFSMTKEQAKEKYGLPEQIIKHYHSCGCVEAHLNTFTTVDAEGYLYADYMCDSQYSNLFRFKVEVEKVQEVEKIQIVEGKLTRGNPDFFRVEGAEGPNNDN